MDINQALERFEKSVDMSFAGNIPSSLLARQDLEALIVKLTFRETPLRDILKRTKGEGRAHLWNQRTGLGANSAELTTSLFYADGDVPVFSDPVYVQKTAAYKYLGVAANITGPMINFLSSLNSTISVKLQSIKKQIGQYRANLLLAESA